MDPIGRSQFQRSLEIRRFVPAKAVQLGTGLEPEQDQTPRQVVNDPASAMGPAQLGPEPAQGRSGQQYWPLAAVLARVPPSVRTRTLGGPVVSVWRRLPERAQGA